MVWGSKPEPRQTTRGPILKKVTCLLPSSRRLAVAPPSPWNRTVWTPHHPCGSLIGCMCSGSCHFSVLSFAAVLDNLRLLEASCLPIVVLSFVGGANVAVHIVCSLLFNQLRVSVFTSIDSRKKLLCWRFRVALMDLYKHQFLRALCPFSKGIEVGFPPGRLTCPAVYSAGLGLHSVQQTLGSVKRGSYNTHATVAPAGMHCQVRCCSSHSSQPGDLHHQCRSPLCIIEATQ